MRDRIEPLAAVLVGEMTPDDAVALMLRLAGTDAGAYLWGMIRHLLASDGVGDQNTIDRRNEVARVMTAPEQHLREADPLLRAVPPEPVPDVSYAEWIHARARTQLAR